MGLSTGGTGEGGTLRSMEVRAIAVQKLIKYFYFEEIGKACQGKSYGVRVRISLCSKRSTKFYNENHLDFSV
ncbi:MAG: hypothetical protein ACKO5Q_21215 [Microcystaceae cyanobacterium]